jgi:hypothetical protein
MKAKERKARFNALSEHGCSVCRQPAEIHHLIGLKYSGMAQKAEDTMTIPLCVNHHRGAEGIHQIGQKTWEEAYGEQEHHLKRIERYLAAYEKIN